MSRRRDYLFKRPDSQFWRVRLQLDGKSKEISLRTSDKLEAERLALPIIAEHKAALLAKRPRLEPSFSFKHPPGEHPQRDGSKIIATPDTVIYLDAKGGFVRQESNKVPGLDLVDYQDFTGTPMIDGKPSPALIKYFDKAKRLLAQSARPKVAAKNFDDGFIETYIAVNKFGGHPAERETRNVWAIFKTLVTKPLKDCTRTEGRMLAAHFEAQGDKSATVKKKVGRICAAVNLAIKDGHLTFNPFAGVAVLGKDATQRLPFSDKDVAACFAKLDKLDPADALTIRVMSATGMRLGEVYEIDREHIEEGVRYVIVGTKTKTSKRRLPLPASLLPYLPKKITAPLVTGDSNVASIRLNRWLNDVVGIDEPGKVAGHSWRHRAQDRMRAVGCPPEIREELFGREKVTVAAGYGKGHPLTVLKQWADKILPRPKLRAVA